MSMYAGYWHHRKKEAVMNYKKEIDMVEKIHSEEVLNLVYWFVRRGYSEERAGK